MPTEIIPTPEERGGEPVQLSVSDPRIVTPGGDDGDVQERQGIRFVGVDPTTLATPPGGANGDVQFNNAGAFDGSPGLSWDGVTLSATAIDVGGQPVTGPGGAPGDVQFHGAGGALDGDPGLSWSGVDLSATGLLVGGRRVLPYTVTAIQVALYGAAIGELVRVDPSGGAFTVNLPTAVGVAGLGITVKNVSASLNVITIDGAGAETIDGLPTTTIASAFGAVTVISDGANWLRFPPV